MHQSWSITGRSSPLKDRSHMFALRTFPKPYTNKYIPSTSPIAPSRSRSPCAHVHTSHLAVCIDPARACRQPKKEMNNDVKWFAGVLFVCVCVLLLTRCAIHSARKHTRIIIFIRSARRRVGMCEMPRTHANTPVAQLRAKLTSRVLAGRGGSSAGVECGRTGRNRGGERGVERRRDCVTLVRNPHPHPKNRARPQKLVCTWTRT